MIKQHKNKLRKKVCAGNELLLTGVGMVSLKVSIEHRTTPLLFLKSNFKKGRG